MVRIKIHTDLDGKKGVSGPFLIAPLDFERLYGEWRSYMATRSGSNGGEYHFINEDGTEVDIAIPYFAVTRFEEVPSFDHDELGETDDSRIGFRR